MTFLLAIVVSTLATACGSPAQTPPKVATSPDVAAELKIDSQLLVEVHRLQNKPAPPGATGVKFDGQRRAFVDVRAEVTADLVAAIAKVGSIVSSSARDHSILAWVPLLEIEPLAGDRTVRAIMPAAQAITQKPAAIGDQLGLHVGGAVTLEPDRLTVIFERVLQDSRCPVNVTCVWAGDAVVRVLVIAGDGSRETLDLHTLAPSERERPFKNYRVQLAGLLPARPSTAEIPADQYLATLTVVTAR